MDTKRASGTAGRKKENFWQNMFKHKGLYLMAFPGLSGLYCSSMLPLPVRSLPLWIMTFIKGSVVASLQG